MRIIVCMKQVPDPEASSSGIKVDTEAKRVIMPQGSPPVLSPYDENALEAALRIKDAQGATVTVISAGRNLAKAVLRKTLAAGADELILLEDNAFERLDSCATAHLLAATIREAGAYDLILCGLRDCRDFEDTGDDRSLQDRAQRREGTGGAGGLRWL